MRLFLLNSLVVPFESEEGGAAYFVVNRLSRDEFVELYRRAKAHDYEIVSAIGHQPTAEFLSSILGEDVTVNRTDVFLESGDLALVVKLKRRLKNPAVTISLEEMLEMDGRGDIEYYALARVDDVISLI